MSAPASSIDIDLIQRLDEERKRGLGLLLVDVQAKRMQLPLASVDIKAQIADRVAQVTVTETFRNPHTEHLEAVYIFPLAAGSAVSNFEMRVKDRVITGTVQERSQARMEYQQAVDDGKRAALLEQERDDVFTVQVGNLPPGEEITVVVTYSERLPFFEDGTTEVRLPLVVAPRYIPGQALDRPAVGEGTSLDTNLVPDASRITPPRLADGFNPKVALNIEVELLADTADSDANGDDTGSGGSNAFSISNLACSQHATKTSLGSAGVKVALAKEDELLNRDFVLRWTLSSSGVKTGLISCTDKTDSKLRYGMLSILPPVREGFLGVPRDVIFVVDRSGSMQGAKMSSAARACSILLNSLGPRDRYAILAFDTVNEWLQPTSQASGEYFVAADEAGIEQGEKFLRGIGARGGTEIYSALEDSLKLVSRTRHNSARMPVIAVLTDGEIGDESRVLKGIQQNLGDTRIFTIGIDTAVNTGFLTRLSSIGGGTCSFVQPGSQLETALTNVAREIGAPIVTDLEIVDDGCGLDSDSIAPNRLPDLFAGRASTCFFRFKPGKRAQLKIRGKLADGGKFEQTVTPQSTTLGAIAQLWAKQRIADLEDLFRVNPSQQAKLRQEIIDISVKHSLLTKFTAFVVVDHSEIVNTSGSTRKVVQPVENPEGWDMCNQQKAAPQQQHASGQQAALPKRAASSLMGQLVRQRAQEPADQAESVRRKISESKAPSPSPAPQPAQQAQAQPAPCFDSSSADRWDAPREAASYDLAPDSLFSAAGGGGSNNAPPAPRPASPDVSKCSIGPIGDSRSQPPCPPPGGSSGASAAGGVFDKLGKLASGFLNQAGKEAADSLEVKEKAKKDHDMSRGFNEVVASLTALQKTLKDAWTDIEQGKIPAFGAIEKARKALMDALANSEVGQNVPLLQKFLRTEAVELIASLKSPGVSASSMHHMIECQKIAFEMAYNEAVDAIELSGGSVKPFWEASI